MKASCPSSETLQTRKDVTCVNVINGIVFEVKSEPASEEAPFSYKAFYGLAFIFSKTENTTRDLNLDNPSLELSKRFTNKQVVSDTETAACAEIGISECVVDLLHPVFSFSSSIQSRAKVENQHFPRCDSC